MIFNFYHTRKNALLIPDGVEYWTVSDIEIDQEPSEPEVSIESSTFQTATTGLILIPYRCQQNIICRHFDAIIYNYGRDSIQHW